MKKTQAVRATARLFLVYLRFAGFLGVPTALNYSASLLYSLALVAVVLRTRLRAFALLARLSGMTEGRE
ncbi:MAG: hypothetical protein K2M95_04330 [Clostridiales bacterium]|nr:hypothetical protein [Clostridiales bacterium]